MVVGLTRSDSGEEFLLPIAYWPARTGVFWWMDFRRQEVRHEFELAASAGLSDLSTVLPWGVFQPDAHRVALDQMRNLDVLLSTADDFGIRLLLSVMPVLLHGEQALPPWMYTSVLDALSVGTSLRDVHVSPTVRDPYVDELAIRAERVILREVLGEFAPHPRTLGWIVGDGFANISSRSTAHLAAWLESVASALPSQSTALWHGVSARHVICDPAFHVDILEENGMGLLLNVDWRPGWASDSRLWTAFLPALIRSLGGRAPLVADSLTFEDDEIARTVRDVHSAGARGYISTAAGQRGSPGLKEYRARNASSSPLEALLTSTGQTQDLGRELAELSGRHLQVQDPSFLVLDPERRSRDPEGLAREAFVEFTR